MIGHPTPPNFSVDIPLVAKPIPCLIRWLDPKSSWGWKKVDELAKDGAEVVESIGWYAGEDEKNVFIAMDWSHEVCNTQGYIKKTDIVKIEFLARRRGWGKGMVGPERPKVEESQSDG